MFDLRLESCDSTVGSHDTPRTGHMILFTSHVTNQGRVMCVMWRSHTQGEVTCHVHMYMYTYMYMYIAQLTTHHRAQKYMYITWRKIHFAYVVLMYMYIELYCTHVVLIHVYTLSVLVYLILMCVMYVWLAVVGVIIWDVFSDQVCVTQYAGELGGHEEAGAGGFHQVPRPSWDGAGEVALTHMLAGDLHMYNVYVRRSLLACTHFVESCACVCVCGLRGGQRPVKGCYSPQASSYKAFSSVLIVLGTRQPRPSALCKSSLHGLII